MIIATLIILLTILAEWLIVALWPDGADGF